MTPELVDDLARWESGEIGLDELDARHPGSDAAELAEMHLWVAVHAEDDDGEPGPAWHEVAARLEDREDPEPAPVVAPAIGEGTPGIVDIRSDVLPELKRTPLRRALAALVAAALVGPASTVLPGLRPLVHAVDTVTRPVRQVVTPLPPEQDDGRESRPPAEVPIEGDNLSSVSPAPASPAPGGVVPGDGLVVEVPGSGSPHEDGSDRGDGGDGGDAVPVDAVPQPAERTTSGHEPVADEPSKQDDGDDSADEGGGDDAGTEDSTEDGTEETAAHPGDGRGLDVAEPGPPGLERAAAAEANGPAEAAPPDRARRDVREPTVRARAGGPRSGASSPEAPAAVSQAEHTPPGRADDRRAPEREPRDGGSPGPAARADTSSAGTSSAGTSSAGTSSAGTSPVEAGRGSAGEATPSSPQVSERRSPRRGSAR